MENYRPASRCVSGIWSFPAADHPGCSFSLLLPASVQLHSGQFLEWKRKELYLCLVGTVASDLQPTLSVLSFPKSTEKACSGGGDWASKSILGNLERSLRTVLQNKSPLILTLSKEKWSIESFKNCFQKSIFVDACLHICVATCIGYRHAYTYMCMWSLEPSLLVFVVGGGGLFVCLLFCFEIGSVTDWSFRIRLGQQIPRFYPSLSLRWQALRSQA